MVENKTANRAVVSQTSKVLYQKLDHLSRKFPELIPEESLTNIHHLVKNSKPAINKKISSSQQELGKLEPRSKNLSVVKGYVIPFLKVPVQRTFQNK